MLKKDSYLTGILLAIPFPVAAFIAATYFFINSILLFNKPALPYLIAIALNLVIMRLVAKQGSVKTVKGILIATFLITLGLFIFKLRLKT